MKALDFIGVIELAYDRSGNDEAWLEAITRAVAPAFSVSSATTSYFFALDDTGAKLGSTVSIGERPYRREDFERMHAEGRAMQGSTRVAYECDMFTTLSRVIGAESASRAMRSARMDGEDSLGLRANMTPDSGIIFTTNVPHRFRIRQRDLWTRIAAHVGSALRLRRTKAPPAPDSAAAVLDARGRLEHGTEAAISARADLAASAQDMDRARGRMRRLDPDAACELWRTMVRGEWTLVDWVDHDGKRFILAQDNQVPVAARKTLTERERQVVAFAAMGHSNKLIAYDLGLSTGTVSVILGRAAKKLGVLGRGALIRAFRESDG